MMRRWTRRELGTLVGGAAVAGMTGTSVGAPTLSHQGGVGLAPLEAETKGGVGAGAAKAAMASVLTGATGAPNAVAAVGSLFSPADVVGIKLNCLGGRRMSPRPEVVTALVDALEAGGVARNRIILFELVNRIFQFI